MSIMRKWIWLGYLEEVMVYKDVGFYKNDTNRAQKIIAKGFGKRIM